MPALTKKEIILKRKQLVSITGYKFRDRELMIRGIARRAYMNDSRPGSGSENEKLATLGDAVIELIVLNHLLPTVGDEGKLTAKKQGLVNHTNLSNVARNAGLKDCLLLGKSEGTEAWVNGQALGESLESLIGAIYLDRSKRKKDGIQKCEMVLRKLGLFN